MNQKLRKSSTHATLQKFRILNADIRVSKPVERELQEAELQRKKFKSYFVVNIYIYYMAEINAAS